MALNGDFIALVDRNNNGNSMWNAVMVMVMVMVMMILMVMP